MSHNKTQTTSIKIGSHTWHVAIACDTGLRRQHNEDSVGVASIYREQSPPLLVAIVADGVASQPDGKRASSDVVRFMLQTLCEATGPGSTILRNAIETANLRMIASFHQQWQRQKTDIINAEKNLIQQQNLPQHAPADTLSPVSQYNPEINEPVTKADMPASTVVAVLIDPVTVVVANLGDSRAYLVSQQRVVQISEDHVDQRRANLLTRYMGVEQVIEPAIKEISIVPGDLLLLCSDGLTNEIQPHRLRDILIEGRRSRKPDMMVDNLVQLAKQRGGRDNISVIALQCDESVDTKLHKTLISKEIVVNTILAALMIFLVFVSIYSILR